MLLAGAAEAAEELASRPPGLGPVAPLDGGAQIRHRIDAPLVSPAGLVERKVARVVVADGIVGEQRSSRTASSSLRFLITWGSGHARALHPCLRAAFSPAYAPPAQVARAGGGASEPAPRRRPDVRDPDGRSSSPAHSKRPVPHRGPHPPRPPDPPASSRPGTPLPRRDADRPLLGGHRRVAKRREVLPGRHRDGPADRRGVDQLAVDVEHRPRVDHHADQAAVPARRAGGRALGDAPPGGSSAAAPGAGSARRGRRRRGPARPAPAWAGGCAAPSASSRAAARARPSGKRSSRALGEAGEPPPGPGPRAPGRAGARRGAADAPKAISLGSSAAKGRRAGEQARGRGRRAPRRRRGDRRARRGSARGP